jgi:hypothetical protein
MRRRILTLAAVCLAYGCALQASPSHEQPIVSIQYRLDGHLLMLPVQVNDAGPAWFTLDSGASHSVIDPRLAADLGLRTSSESATTGTGQGAISVGHAGPVVLRIGDFSLPVEDPWIIDLSGVPLDREVRGLVGADLFKNNIVRIDPDRGVLEIFAADGLQSFAGGATLPLFLDGDKLYIDAVLDVRSGLSVQHRLRIDTGSEESVNDEIVAQSAQTRTTTLGNGLGANFEGVSGVFDAVHFGPYTIYHVWGPGGPGPAVGMEVLRRFVVTFDVPRGRVNLVPGRAFPDPVPAPG